MATALQVRCIETFGEREIRELRDVLIDCFEGGASEGSASVSFMNPMTPAKADAFWRSAASIGYDDPPAIGRK